ncbi:MAG: DUF5915 domain-containing protein, partial [Candidatus Pacearchaeota archaeon]|nr:DUF5915 domain-containing protein [Candidatus Pacearchaeota archaeon]
MNNFPAKRDGLTDPDLELKMKLVRQAVTMGRALRSRFTIKTRQPLSEFTIIVRDQEICTLLRNNEQMIREELNVKEVRFDTNEEIVVSVHAKPNFKRLGRVFGSAMKKAADEIGKFTVEQIRTLEAGETITVEGHPVTFEDIEIRRVKHEGVEVETEGELTVALDTTITDELRAEGMAREFVNRVQNLRKSAEFQVSDRITITTTATGELADAVRKHQEYICSETLALSIDFVGSETDGMESLDVDGHMTHIGVARSDQQ